MISATSPPEATRCGGDADVVLAGRKPIAGPASRRGAGDARLKVIRLDIDPTELER